MLKKLRANQKNQDYKLVLEVYLKEGRDLVLDPWGSTCNPVAYACLPHSKPGSTGRQKHTAYPHWNSKIKLKLCEDLSIPSPYLKIVVFDAQRRHPLEYLGELRISLKDIRFGGDYQWYRLHSSKSEKRFVTGSVYLKFELKKRKRKLKKSSSTSDLSMKPMESLWTSYLESIDPFSHSRTDTTVTDDQGFYQFDANDDTIEQFLTESESDDDEDDVLVDLPTPTSGAELLKIVDYKNTNDSDSDISEESLVSDENDVAASNTVASHMLSHLPSHVATSSTSLNHLQLPKPTTLYLRDSGSQTDLETTDNNSTACGSGSAPRSKKKARFKISTKKHKDTYKFSVARGVLGVVFLEIISAEGLPPFKSATRTGFDMDPFVVVSFGRKVFRSSWRKHTLSPIFNERLAFEVLESEKNYEIQFNVLDKDHFSFHDKVGTANIQVGKLMDDEELEQVLLEENAQMELLDLESDTSLKRKRKLIGRNPERNLNKSIRDSTKLKTFNLRLSMNNSVSKLIKQDGDYNPTLKIRARFEPYQLLRALFWTNLLSKYDEEKLGVLDVLQLEHFFKCVGTNLSDATIQSFFTDNGKNPWAGDTLSIEQIVACFERRIELQKQHGDLLLDNEYFIEVAVCPICNKKRLSHRSESDIVTHVAICASRDWSTVNKLLKPSFASGQMATKRWYSKVFIKLTYGKYGIGRNSANILVQDRNTGLIMEEKMSVYVRLGIKLFYRSVFDRAIDKKKMKRLLRNVTIKQGAKFDLPMSASQIGSFVDFHQLDLSDCLVQDICKFPTFNEFFYRKLVPGARPLESTDNTILCSPSDSRCTVFENVSLAKDIWIKGKDFSISKLLYKNDQGLLLAPEELQKFTQGSIGVFRLAPQDYHRFHSPCDGVVGEPMFIDGEYYTVNPMAIRSELDVFGDNVRCVIPIQTERFGTVIMIPVGAMMVGSILLTVKQGDTVKRGDEIGYFKFGGSTIILLFEKDVFQFDSDLVLNSKESIETLVRVGMSIGHSPSVPEHQREYRDFNKQPEADKLRIIRSITGGLGVKGPSMDMIDASLISKINKYQLTDDISLKELSWEAYNIAIDEEDENLLKGMNLDEIPDDVDDETGR